MLSLERSILAVLSVVMLVLGSNFYWPKDSLVYPRKVTRAKSHSSNATEAADTYFYFPFPSCSVHLIDNMSEQHAASICLWDHIALAIQIAVVNDAKNGPFDIPGRNETIALVHDLWCEPAI